MTTHLELMVRTMRPESATAVAAAFARHDATELPHLLGVRRRTLFHHRGVYAHLIEAGEDLLDRLAEAREDARFTEVDRAVAQHLRPVDPLRPSMVQARARRFYSWPPA